MDISLFFLHISDCQESLSYFVCFAFLCVCKLVTRSFRLPGWEGKLKSGGRLGSPKRAGIRPSLGKGGTGYVFIFESRGLCRKRGFLDIK